MKRKRQGKVLFLLDRHDTCIPDHGQGFHREVGAAVLEKAPLAEARLNVVVIVGDLFNFRGDILVIKFAHQPSQEIIQTVRRQVFDCTLHDLEHLLFTLPVATLKEKGLASVWLIQVEDHIGVYMERTSDLEVATRASSLQPKACTFGV